MEVVQYTPIGYINNNFKEKFGIPRQSGMHHAESEIVFHEEYAVPEAFREIEQYSYLWIVWVISDNVGKKWNPTVRPPRLGGNKRVGVFASRSPFRPNPIGLSCVRLLRVEWKREEGPVLIVSGADLLDGTPILDIKPYLPYVESHEDAKGGFADDKKDYELFVEFSLQAEEQLGVLKETIEEILRQDPRPAYQEDEARIYGMSYGEFEIKFQVKKNRLYVLTVENR